MSICDRLFELIGSPRGRQEQLAAHLGVKATTITNWKQRGSDPPAKLIIPICEFLGCSVAYLLTGMDTKTADSEFEGIGVDGLRAGLLWEQLDEPGRAIILGEMYKRLEAKSSSHNADADVAPTQRAGMVG